MSHKLGGGSTYKQKIATLFSLMPWILVFCVVGLEVGFGFDKVK